MKKMINSILASLLMCNLILHCGPQNYDLKLFFVFVFLSSSINVLQIVCLCKFLWLHMLKQFLCVCLP